MIVNRTILDVWALKIIHLSNTLPAENIGIWTTESSTEVRNHSIILWEYPYFATEQIIVIAYSFTIVTALLEHIESSLDQSVDSDVV